jgi:hypothetical protein
MKWPLEGRVSSIRENAALRRHCVGRSFVAPFPPLPTPGVDILSIS